MDGTAAPTVNGCEDQGQNTSARVLPVGTWPSESSGSTTVGDEDSDEDHGDLSLDLDEDLYHDYHMDNCTSELQLAECSVRHEDSSTRVTCVVKNERERTRVRRKADLLERLKYLIKQSSLAEEAKPKRLTELYTLRLIQEVIIVYRRALEQLGHPSTLILPFSAQASNT